jgi:tellurite resistance protein TehA-like permease
MGAMAITTLAGAVLVSLAPESALLQAVLPFLQGLTILAWAVATWWIPLLVVLFAWRHLVGKVGLYYDPQYWSMVFPLGMYSVCTFRLAQVTGFAFLQHLSQAFAYVAVAAWAAVFMGLARHILGELQSAPVVRWEEADQPADLPPDNGPSPH